MQLEVGEAECLDTFKGFGPLRLKPSRVSIAQWLSFDGRCEPFLNADSNSLLVSFLVCLE